MKGEIMNIADYLTADPIVIWTLVLICAVSVIGAVDFIKCWIKKKAQVKWAVLFISLAVAFVNSPMIPAYIATIVDVWLLTLAVSTLARNAVVDGLPSIISRLMGAAERAGRGE
jgi:membrane protease YdiL (CAAX protease family)